MSNMSLWECVPRVYSDIALYRKFEHPTILVCVGVLDSIFWGHQRTAHSQCSTHLGWNHICFVWCKQNLMNLTYIKKINRYVTSIREGLDRSLSRETSRTPETNTICSQASFLPTGFITTTSLRHTEDKDDIPVSQVMKLRANCQGKPSYSQDNINLLALCLLLRGHIKFPLEANKKVAMHLNAWE